MCKLAAVGQMIHKYDEIICSIHQGGHPASHSRFTSDRASHSATVRTDVPADALLSVEVDILFSPQPIGSEHENRDLQHLYEIFPALSLR